MQLVMPLCVIWTQKTNDGKVTIHDPQSENGGQADQDDFRRYVKDDRGIIIYAVNTIKLREIIEENEDILHKTFMHVPNQIFPVVPLSN